MPRKLMLTLVLLALVAALGLTACGSEPIHGVYTAAGDGNDPASLTRTSTFQPTDDLNVVITLNSHNRDLPIHAVFTGPGGTAIYATDSIEASETAGEVLLGLDWELAGSVPWPAGEWTVDVFVDDELEKSLSFEVLAPEPTPASEG